MYMSYIHAYIHIYIYTYILSRHGTFVSEGMQTCAGLRWECIIELSVMELSGPK